MRFFVTLVRWLPECSIGPVRQCRKPPAISSPASMATVLWVHCARLNARGSIGKVTSPQIVPDGVDYNLWAGPAQMTLVTRKMFHCERQAGTFS